MYLSVPGLSCDTQDLLFWCVNSYLQPVGSSSPTRDWTLHWEQSLNHWTTSEVPLQPFFIYQWFSLLISSFFLVFLEGAGLVPLWSFPWFNKGISFCKADSLSISKGKKMKVKVTQLCPTLCDPVDYTVRGILQARILEWLAFPFSRGYSQPRDWTQVSRIAGRFFTSWTTREQHPCCILSKGALFT